jgi:hypothetical protein
VWLQYIVAVASFLSVRPTLVVWKALFSATRTLHLPLLSTRICCLTFSSVHKKEGLFLLVVQRIDLMPLRILQVSARHVALLVDGAVMMMPESLIAFVDEVK